RNKIRRELGIKKIKVGHAGTLDPLATGLMIICTGKNTKKISELTNRDKEYIATFHIGKTTPSFDLETEVDATYPTDHITKELVVETLNKFIGKQQQMPPLHSAKFIDGKRAYEFARKGIEKELKPVEIEIKEIELIDYNMPEIKVRILCSKGTYIRSFARDFGKALNSGAYMSALVRTKIGEFDLKDAYTLDSFDELLQSFANKNE
ncbi:MAG: tRNA pseudouridine(55) synthase TruB, partial [Bacteroidales bacterium]|nr:tRNA pseudouridine(55) synthase TruB [Bacteroidales bacterium]